MKTFFWICIMGALLASSAAWAKGVSVEPGLWEMKMTMTMPMMPAPQVRSSTECVEEDELDPEQFQMEGESPCSFGDVVVDGDTVAWTLECPSDMGSMTGEWSFTSEGDSMHGEGAMDIDMGGQKMVFTMSWEGERVGDCD
jgi:hypothetical protein